MMLRLAVRGLGRPARLQRPRLARAGWRASSSTPTRGSSLLDVLSSWWRPKGGAEPPAQAPADVEPASRAGGADAAPPALAGGLAAAAPALDQGLQTSSIEADRAPSAPARPRPRDGGGQAELLVPPRALSPVRFGALDAEQQCALLGDIYAHFRAQLLDDAPLAALQNAADALARAPPAAPAAARRGAPAVLPARLLTYSAVAQLGLPRLAAELRARGVELPAALGSGEAARVRLAASLIARLEREHAEAEARLCAGAPLAARAALPEAGEGAEESSGRSQRRSRSRKSSLPAPPVEIAAGVDLRRGAAPYLQKGLCDELLVPLHPPSPSPSPSASPSASVQPAGLGRSLELLVTIGKLVETHRQLAMPRKAAGGSSCSVPPVMRFSADAHWMAPLVAFGGRTIVAETLPDAEEALQALASESVLGLDTEWPPTYARGEGSKRTALVQVASASRVVLLRLSKIGSCPPALAELLANPRVFKVGVGLEADIAKLLRDFPLTGARAGAADGPAALPTASAGSKAPQAAQLVARRVVDLQSLVRHADGHPVGLQTLALAYMGARLDKSAQMTDWAAHRLSVEQVRYAATDAWASRQVYAAMVLAHSFAPPEGVTVSLGAAGTTIKRGKAAAAAGEAGARPPRAASGAAPGADEAEEGTGAPARAQLDASGAHAGAREWAAGAHERELLGMMADGAFEAAGGVARAPARAGARAGNAAAGAADAARGGRLEDGEQGGDDGAWASYLRKYGDGVYGAGLGGEEAGSGVRAGDAGRGQSDSGPRAARDSGGELGGSPMDPLFDLGGDEPAAALAEQLGEGALEDSALELGAGRDVLRRGAKGRAPPGGERASGREEAPRAAAPRDAALRGGTATRAGAAQRAAATSAEAESVRGATEEASREAGSGRLRWEATEEELLAEMAAEARSAAGVAEAAAAGGEAAAQARAPGGKSARKGRRAAERARASADGAPERSAELGPDQPAPASASAELVDPSSAPGGVSAAAASPSASPPAPAPPAGRPALGTAIEGAQRWKAGALVGSAAGLEGTELGESTTPPFPQQAAAGIGRGLLAEPREAPSGPSAADDEAGAFDAAAVAQRRAGGNEAHADGQGLSHSSQAQSR